MRDLTSGDISISLGTSRVIHVPSEPLESTRIDYQAMA